jgi:Bacterial PH domain
VSPARAVLRRWARPPVLDPDGRAAEGPVLVIRPRRVTIAAWVCAVGTVAVFTVVATLLRTRDTGVYFRTADQVAMVLLGVLIAAGILLLARPRVRADARGVEVRNVGTPRYLPWELVHAVSFPDGASWARLDLPHYEYVSMVAVQAVDGARAVAAMRQLRALHAAARVPAPAPEASEPPGAGPGGPADPRT